jgi:nucleoside-diphosphate-sugar epimerase
MTIAVTGATGFIGRHVVSALGAQGCTATLATRSSSASKQSDTSHKMVQMDMVGETDPYEVLGRPNVLVHLAWNGLPNYHSNHHVDEELPSQINFLRRMVTGGLQHLVVAGTCLEYGMQSGCLHEALAAEPTTHYGMAKNALRLDLEEVQRDVPFTLVWARLFYIFGQGQAETSLFGQLNTAINRGDAEFPMSSGEQIRDYLPVETAAQHLVTLALARRQVGIVNVCSGEPISVIELVRDWVQEFGWSIRLNPGRYPYPDYEPMAFWGDRAKLERELSAGSAL